jgi:Predicted 3''-5'' exonuclease related to the exonuclease domain of PolB.
MLKNDIPELILFFDLEWVPDAAGAVRLFDLPPETTELEAMQEFWKRADKKDGEERPFIKYLYSRVVSIAFLSRKLIYRDNVPELEFSLNSLPKLPIDGVEPDESYIIDRFLYFIGERNPQIVGFNSLDSDLQVLIQRGMVNGVRAPAFCTRPMKPWDGRDYFDSKFGEWHLDLIKRFSNYKMTPTLDHLAKLCGFPGKIDVDGSQVVDLWLERDIAKIVEYNQIDALNTYLVWLRLVYFCGKMDDDGYLCEQNQFREFLEAEASKPDKEYLQKFLEKWD